MTLQVAEMLATYPKDLGGVDRQRLTACRDCERACRDLLAALG